MKQPQPRHHRTTPSDNTLVPTSNPSTSQTSITVKSAWYAGLVFDSAAATVQFTGDILVLRNADGQSTATVQVRDLDQVTTKNGAFSAELRIADRNGNTWTCRGMQSKQSATLATAVQRRIHDHRIQEAKPIAHKITPEILKAGRHVERWLSGGNRYRRQSEIQPLATTIHSIVSRCDQYIIECLNAPAKREIQQLTKLNDPGALEKARQLANRSYVEKTTPKVLYSVQQTFQRNLTPEQAEAVATDEDATMVLAGAGAGKTAVITAKVAHLVQDLGVTPESILVLAFNRDAAEEIRQRLPGQLAEAHVQTFHALARRIVADLHEAPAITPLAEDRVRYNQTIDRLLRESAEDETVAKAILEVSTSLSSEPIQPFDFNTEAEYVDYARHQEFRTLNNIRVKSHQEVLVANFLTQHSVNFRYEAPYPHHTATTEHRRYEPDFYLPNHDIYIEHFALDQDGNPPAGWEGYLEGVRWKRQLHASKRTTLIETQSWQERAGTLLTQLADDLRSRGVVLEPVPTEELLLQLNGERFTWLSRLLGRFLEHYKSGAASHDEVSLRSADNPNPRRAGQFLIVFKAVEQLYRQLLEARQEKDFNDLINDAAAALETGCWNRQYEHILVDEFQDISAGRMRLLKALKGPQSSTFLVGDDWQSIYRFAGSRVDLMQRCDQHLGFTQRINLTRTFRFGDGILEPSSAFVQRNPTQSQRPMRSEQTSDGITVIANRNQDQAIAHALTAIRQTGQPEDSILLLGRYHHSYNGDSNTRRIDNSRFLTVHRAKGQEADHVIILDVNGGKLGFPNTIGDDPILEMVIPPEPADQSMKNAEERRLFYVALTRAKKSVFIVTDPYNPSPFVEELVEIAPSVGQTNKLSQRCPVCGEGALSLSQSGENLRCSRGPKCPHLSPRCIHCDDGFVTITPHRVGIEPTGVCSNPDCRSEATICPKCRRGVLRIVRLNGGFLGCSRYYADPTCLHRERISHPEVMRRASMFNAPRARQETAHHPQRSYQNSNRYQDQRRNQSHRNRNPRPCPGCGNVANIYHRGRNSPYLCTACHNARRQTR